MGSNQVVFEILKNGFSRKLVTRMNGKSKGTVDIYVFTPDGLRLRSKPELRTFLEQYEGDTIDLDDAFKKPPKSSTNGSAPKSKAKNQQGEKLPRDPGDGLVTCKRPADMALADINEISKKQKLDSDAPLSKDFSPLNIARGKQIAQPPGGMPNKTAAGSLGKNAPRKAGNEKENSKKKKSRAKKQKANEGTNEQSAPNSEVGKVTTPETPAIKMPELPDKGRNLLDTIVEKPLRSPYGLIYESLAEEPWKVIYAAFLLQRTNAIKGNCLVHSFFAEFPSLKTLTNKNALLKFFTGNRAIPCVDWAVKEIIQMTEDLTRGVSSVHELRDVEKYTIEVFEVFCAGRWAHYEPMSLDLSMYVKWRRAQKSN